MDELQLYVVVAGMDHWPTLRELARIIRYKRSIRANIPQLYDFVQASERFEVCESSFRSKYQGDIRIKVKTIQQNKGDSHAKL